MGTEDLCCGTGLIQVTRQVLTMAGDCRIVRTPGVSVHTAVEACATGSLHRTCPFNKKSVAVTAVTTGMTSEPGLAAWLLHPTAGAATGKVSPASSARPPAPAVCAGPDETVTGGPDSCPGSASTPGCPAS